MKKILFAIYNLSAGGGQKSLVSLLNTIPKDKYSIDLLLMDKKGLFLSQVPEFVNIIEGEKKLKAIHHPISDFKFFTPLNRLWWKILHSRLKAKIFYKHLHREQAQWKTWNSHIKTLEKEYDCAISYLEGVMNYFIMDKVKAKRKILWIHNVYTSLHYNPSFDFNYFNQADYVVTMSESGIQSLQENFPSIKSKFIVLENISNGNLIKKLAQEPIQEKEFKDFKGLKLLSVGRLMEQKNYPLAITTASELKKKNINFIWYVIGEGSDRAKLESLIAKESLKNHFKLVGLRPNPYQ